MNKRATTEKQKQDFAKAGRPKLDNQASQSKEKKTTAKAGRPRSTKSAASKPKQASKPTSKPTAGSATKKPAARKPRQPKLIRKSSDTKLAIIIPPGWKPPTKRTSSSKRNTKSTRLKH